MAGAASPHNALRRGLWVPDRRTGGFSPLRTPRQSRTRNGYRFPRSSTPQTRLCGRSGICQTPSRRSDAGLSSVWLSICHAVLVAEQGELHEISGLYDAVRLSRILLIRPESNSSKDQSIRCGVLSQRLQRAAPAEIVGEVFRSKAMDAAQPFFKASVVGIDVVDMEIGCLQVWFVRCGQRPQPRCHRRNRIRWKS